MRLKSMLLVIAVLCTAMARAGEPCGKPPCEKPRSCFSLFKKKDCAKEEKECVRVDDKKKVTHTHYGMIEKDVCKSNCTKCNLGKKKCGSCKEEKCDQCDKCGKVRTVRQLVKRFEVEEVCTTKCVPVVKECPTVHCAPPAPVPGPEKLPVKPIPADPMKK